MDDRTSPRSLLECMMLIRAFELRNSALAAERKAPGTCTSVGQEASAVGVIRALEARDKILTNHRSAGHLLARGADPGRVLAEILGKRAGYCKGKSGTLHISVKELGVVLTSTIVGGELSLATGVGLSVQMLEKGSIVCCIFGDGAACEGVFHESLNLAAVWKLPILYVCENNEWQAFVHRKETMLTDRISSRAAAYGMEGRSVDGNDVDAVLEAAKKAAEQVRETGRPFLLETLTYRTRGHYEPDDQGYVDKDELASWKRRDPIETYEKSLLEKKVVAAADVAAMKKRVEETLDRAHAFAADSPYPDFADLTTDVYA